MSFQPVLLHTDLLLWLLVGAVALYARHCLRRPHLAAPWRRVFAGRGAIVALVLLAPYLAIGLADSVHYRERLPQVEPGAPVAWSPEVLSLLDLAARPLRASREKTYSAPFATRLFTKEQVERPDGRIERGYARLRHGGAHLADESSRGADVARRMLGGLAAAGVLCAVFGWAARRLGRRMPQVPWIAGAWTAGALAVLALPVLACAGAWHVLGTDKVGQDVLYLALKSIRTSLVIGTLTTLTMLPFGIAFGLAAGYFRGWVDDAVQYVYTTLNSIPGVLLIAAAVLMMQVFIDTHPGWFGTAAERADFRLLVLCLILGLTTWTGLTRLLRGETLKIAGHEYILAAHAFGVAHARILARHVLPNAAHLVIITVALEFSSLVLTEAVLSYIGVGVDPATTSFGTMINAARLEMSRDPVVWWSIAAAFGFMVMLVLAANLFADAVRDGFDPRVRVGAAPAAAEAA